MPSVPQVRQLRRASSAAAESRCFSAQRDLKGSQGKIQPMGFQTTDPDRLFHCFQGLCPSPERKQQITLFGCLSLGPTISNPDHMPRPNIIFLQSRYKTITRGYYVSLRARQSFSVRFLHHLGNTDVRNMVSQFPTLTSHLIMHAKSPLLFNDIEIVYYRGINMF
jgi:hypothetical protein